MCVCVRVIGPGGLNGSIRPVLLFWSHGPARRRTWKQFVQKQEKASRAIITTQKTVVHFRPAEMSSLMHVYEIQTSSTWKPDPAVRETVASAACLTQHPALGLISPANTSLALVLSGGLHLQRFAVSSHQPRERHICNYHLAQKMACRAYKRCTSRKMLMLDFGLKTLVSTSHACMFVYVHANLNYAISQKKKTTNLMLVNATKKSTTGKQRRFFWKVNMTFSLHILVKKPPQ